MKKRDAALRKPPRTRRVCGRCGRISTAWPIVRWQECTAPCDAVWTEEGMEWAKEWLGGCGQRVWNGPKGCSTGVTEGMEWAKGWIDGCDRGGGMGLGGARQHAGARHVGVSVRLPCYTF
eukprot:303633-Chlamydomonas_euryale.AAC.4